MHYFILYIIWKPHCVVKFRNVTEILRNILLVIGYINHHPHFAPLTRISLTLSCNLSLLFIAPRRSISCIGTELLYIGSSWPSCFCSFTCRGLQEYTGYEFVPTSTACLVRLTLIVFVMDGRSPYSCCFVGCCHQDLFNRTRSIRVYLPLSFFLHTFC